MKNKANIPILLKSEIEDGFLKANESHRKRYAKIIHQQGAEFNEGFNFMIRDTYMQPHLHPSEEKKENIYIIQGKVAVLFFDNEGGIDQVIRLERSNQEHIEVPAFTWHTYVMLSNSALTYETMMGKYDPNTWKEMAVWAPEENTSNSSSYLATLEKIITVSTEEKL